MPIKKITLSIILCFVVSVNIFSGNCSANDKWRMARTYESNAIIDSPYILFTIADLDNNGLKEIVISDFGQSGNHIEEIKQWKVFSSPYTFGVLEWTGSELVTKFIKRWDMSKTHTDDDAHRYFLAYEAKQLVSVKNGKHELVETFPPYLGIEWLKGKYILHEQQGALTSGALVGSWIFPWMSPSCYQGFPNFTTWPKECLMGIRDFGEKGSPKVVTVLEKEVVKGFQYKQTIRVRKLAPGFPIEWESESSKRFVINEPVDRLNYTADDGLLMRMYRTASWSLLKKIEKGYLVQSIKASGPKGVELYDLPDYYLRRTKNRNIEEYWGYRKVEHQDPKYLNFTLLLRAVRISPDNSTFIKEDIDFPHHENFIGVGYFDLKDIDADGLDEVILVEETAGKLAFGDEMVLFSDVKDYIHILKWDGSKYMTMWVSPPYTKRGTKFLVEDIKNAGKKQLVVLTPYGTIQIWEKQ